MAPGMQLQILSITVSRNSLRRSGTKGKGTSPQHLTVPILKELYRWPECSLLETPDGVAEVDPGRSTPRATWVPGWEYSKPNRPMIFNSRVLPYLLEVKSA